MLAEKLLANQVKDIDKVKKIISFLCSESGSHDYTINRREASTELGLNIEKPDQELYTIIKATYDSIRDELELRSQFDPNTFIGENFEKEYLMRRVLIESIKGGADVFVSEGKILRIEQQIPNPHTSQGTIDQRFFEGWRHYDE